MAWLFERTIELAAWVAFVLGLVCLVDALWLFYQFVTLWMNDETAPQIIYQAGQAGAAFVLFTLAMGALACVDRYVFDLPASTAKR